MPHFNLIARKSLIQQSNTFVGSGADFGAQLTTPYTRISGMAFIIGSMTIRLRSQIDLNGPFLVTSSWVTNSGANFLDVPNRANYVSFDVTAANSQVASLLFVGEPLR